MVLQQERSMTDLAETISASTKVLSEYIGKHNLREPSFSAEGPIPDFIPREDRAIQQIRFDLADAAKQLYELSLGPSALLINQSVHGMHESSVLRSIYTFNIPKHIPISDSITYQELSQKTGLQEDALRRILGYAFTMRIFHESQPNYVAHTATSKMLATEDDCMDFLGHMTEDIFPSTPYQSTALSKWFSREQAEPVPDESNGGPESSARCGAGLAFGFKDSLFSHWAQNSPERVGRFLGAMKYLNRANPISANEVENLFNWQSLGSSTVCDVGGSAGHKSKIIALAGPQLKVVAQDLPEVVIEAERNASNEKDMKDLMDSERLVFEQYNFFTPQPYKDAKAYFYGHIFHDWGDADCIKILDNLVPSMQQDAYLILNEFVLAEPGSATYNIERVTRMADMQMMTAVNARERTLDQWKELIEQGSNGKLEYVDHSHQYNAVIFKRGSK